MPNLSQAQNVSLLILVVGMFIGLSGLYLKLQGSLETATEAEKVLARSLSDSVMNTGAGISMLGMCSLFFSTYLKSRTPHRDDDPALALG